jgi:type II secretory pathway pseudopilin PulG
MIMGFLLAMIAPRFAGIFGDSEDTICDTNIKTTRQYLAGFEMSNNRLPNNLINLVNNGSTTGYAGPCEEDPMTDGLETFTTAILERITLGNHNIDANEAIELGKMGISTVLNWNNEGDASDGATVKTDIFGAATPDITGDMQSSMEKVEVASGMKMLMIGGGNAGTTWYDVYQPSQGAYPYTASVVGAQAGDFRWFNRIILGVGPDCELVTSGYCQAAGICPSYERGASQSTAWGYYCMVLPRMQATIDQMEATGSTAAGQMRTITVEAAGDEAAANPQQIEVDLLASYDKIAEFDVFCPEGHLWPELAEMWEIVTIDTTI